MVKLGLIQGLDKQRPPKPSVNWMTRQVWNQACDLSDSIPAFRGIYNDLTKTPCWIKLGDNLVSCLMYLDNTHSLLDIVIDIKNSVKISLWQFHLTELTLNSSCSLHLQ